MLYVRRPPSSGHDQQIPGIHTYPSSSTISTMYNFQKQRTQQKPVRATHKQLPQIYTRFQKPVPEQLQVVSFPPAPPPRRPSPAPPAHLRTTNSHPIVHQAPASYRNGTPPPPPAHRLQPASKSSREGVSYIGYNSHSRGEAPSDVAARLQAEIDDIVAKIGKCKAASTGIEQGEVDIMHASPGGDYLATPRRQSTFKISPPTSYSTKPHQQQYVPRQRTAPQTPPAEFYPDSAVSPFTVPYSESRHGGYANAGKGITFNENVWEDSRRLEENGYRGVGREGRRYGGRR